KMEAGHLALRPTEVDLAEVVDNVILSFTPLAQERGIPLAAVVAVRPVPCFVDSDKITQVLTNLVNNALKFTRQGQITITLEAASDVVRCALKDTGIGIAPDQMHRVFGKFQQFGAA